MVKKFYKNNQLNHEWVEKEAEKTAKNFRRLSSSQLRNFFNELKNLQHLASDKDKKSFNTEILPHIKLIKAKAQYRTNKRQAGWDSKFGDFIKALIDTIKNKETLDNACLIMEAIVGYFPKKN